MNPFKFTQISCGNWWVVSRETDRHLGQILGEGRDWQAIGPQKEGCRQLWSKHFPSRQDAAEWLLKTGGSYKAINARLIDPARVPDGNGLWYLDGLPVDVRGEPGDMDVSDIGSGIGMSISEIPPVRWGGRVPPSPYPVATEQEVGKCPDCGSTGMAYGDPGGIFYDGTPARCGGGWCDTTGQVIGGSVVW